MLWLSLSLVTLTAALWLAAWDAQVQMERGGWLIGVDW